MPRTVKILSYRQELDLRRGMLLRTITLRGRPGAAHHAQGAPPGLDERHAPGRAGAGADRRELVRQASRSVRRSTGASSTRARSSIANSTTNTWSRWQARSLARTACICWCAPASRIFMSRRRRERERSSTDSFARARAESSTNRDTSGRNWRSTSGRARPWCWRSSPLSIPREIRPSPSAALAARKAIARAGRFDAVMADHVLAWKHLWRRFDVHIQPAEPGFKLNVPMLLRLNMFHLLQAVSPNSIGLDIGVPARGWTGEAYQGHIFWDELFIFPFLNYRMPEITRSLLHVSLPAPRRGARRGQKRGVSGRDVSLAKRQRRTGGNPGAQPEPALAALGA